ncbi:MAG: P-loop NTPase, partial [Acidimicrobiales bacterium]
MAITEAGVRAALGAVDEPTLHIPLAEAGMVGAVRVDRGGRVAMTIVLPDPRWPRRDELARRVDQALVSVGGITEVEGQVGAMGPGEREGLAQRLRGAWATHENAGQPGHGHDAGPDQAPPFMQPGSPTRVLGISSGKGGVGKSSLTVNLAVALARAGRQAAVLDADVYGFSVPAMLGITDPPIDLARELLVPPVAHGVACMSMDYFVPGDRAVIWRGPMLHKALSEFLTNVWWGEPDFLLVDMPPGTGDVALSMARYLPRAEVYVVTTPQAAAQRVARRTGLMARDRNVNLPVKGVIENMSWFT